MADRMGDLASESDYLVPPPRSPMTGFNEALARGLRTSPWLGGTGPATPGILTEEDQFRANQMRQAITDQGAEGGFKEAMNPSWAVMAALRGLPLRSVTSMGAGAAQGSMATSTPERVTGAAYRVGDNVFEGPIHVIAQERAMQSLGAKNAMGLIDRQPGANLSDRLKAHNAADGFVTSSGRFVTRKEAEDIAAVSGQIEPAKRGQRLGGMNAEDLKKYGLAGAVPPVMGAMASQDQYQ